MSARKQEAIRKLQETPEKVLDSARKGNIQDLTDLVNNWTVDGSALLGLGVLDVLFHHLHADKTPIHVNKRRLDSLEFKCAWLSLHGLARLGNIFDTGLDASPYDNAIEQAWPGIFKWAAYLYAARVEPAAVPLVDRQKAINLIGGAWSAIARTSHIANIMGSTKGSVEIATRLCMLEDDSLPSFTAMPSATEALDFLLKADDEEIHNRVVQTTGGKPKQIVKLVMSRIKSWTSDITKIQHPPTLAHMSLLVHLCRYPDHPFRHGFLSQGAITLFTNIAASCGRLLNSSGYQFHVVEVMASAFCFLSNCLESTDGFTWVTQSVKAGLLAAYVDCSPFFYHMVQEDQHMVIRLIEELLPRYLIYRSVLRAMDKSVAITRLNDPDRIDRINQSFAKGAWHRFYAQLQQRVSITNDAENWNWMEETCDNDECKRSDAKDNFRKCSACQSALYCSVDCQKKAWKEGGHKQECQSKQEERENGEFSKFLRSDLAFWNHFPPYDAMWARPQLLEQARSRYPNLPLTDLFISIDYTVAPANYTVSPLAEYNEVVGIPGGSDDYADHLAWKDSLIERAQASAGELTLLRSIIANGVGCHMSLTLIAGDYWNKFTPMDMANLVRQLVWASGTPRVEEYHDD